MSTETDPREAIRDALMTAWKDDYSFASVVDGLMPTIAALTAKARADDTDEIHPSVQWVADIIAAAVPADDTQPRMCRFCGDRSVGPTGTLCGSCKRFETDHPDYDESWRP